MRLKSQNTKTNKLNYRCRSKYFLANITFSSFIFFFNVNSHMFFLFKNLFFWNIFFIIFNNFLCIAYNSFFLLWSISYCFFSFLINIFILIDLIRIFFIFNCISDNVMYCFVRFIENNLLALIFWISKINLICKTRNILVQNKKQSTYF